MLPKFTIQVPVEEPGVDALLLVASSKKAAIELLN